MPDILARADQIVSRAIGPLRGCREQSPSSISGDDSIWEPRLATGAGGACPGRVHQLAANAQAVHQSNAARATTTNRAATYGSDGTKDRLGRDSGGRSAGRVQAGSNVSVDGRTSRSMADSGSVLASRVMMMPARPPGCRSQQGRRSSPAASATGRLAGSASHLGSRASALPRQTACAE
jgi:hypothetical protein